MINKSPASRFRFKHRCSNAENPTSAFLRSHGLGAGAAQGTSCTGVGSAAGLMLAGPMI